MRIKIAQVFKTTPVALISRFANNKGDWKGGLIKALGQFGLVDTNAKLWKKKAKRRITKLQPIGRRGEIIQDMGRDSHTYTLEGELYRRFEGPSNIYSLFEIASDPFITLSVLERFFENSEPLIMVAELEATNVIITDFQVELNASKRNRFPYKLELLEIIDMPFNTRMTMRGIPTGIGALVSVVPSLLDGVV